MAEWLAGTLCLPACLRNTALSVSLPSKRGSPKGTDGDGCGSIHACAEPARGAGSWQLDGLLFTEGHISLPSQVS